MNREEKTIVVSLLTVFLLAFSNLLTAGKFIFTFPINDFLFLIITLYFSYFHFKKDWKAYLLLICFSIANLLSHLFNYEFFLNQENLNRLSNSNFTDILELTSYLFYFALLVYLLSLSYSKRGLNLLLLIIFAFIFAEIYHLESLKTITYFMIIPLHLFLKKNIQENIKEIYLLLIFFSILNATKYLTLYIL
jgi:hypothetical protein